MLVTVPNVVVLELDWELRVIYLIILSVKTKNKGGFEAPTIVNVCFVWIDII